MTLDAVVGVSSRGVNAALTVPSGTTLALLGPNGAGKTTVIEALAGLIAPDSGRATLAGSVLFAGDNGRMRATEARTRGIALVTQEAALFPHLTTLDNVAFPQRVQGASKARSRATAKEWLDRVGAFHLASRKARTLSGGEARRVAVARALASEPRLMLLDEPFASLDVEAAVSMRTLMREVLRGITTVISTHDGLDAIDLADSIAVLDRGVVVEQGATAATFERPRTAFTAAMAGLVWLTGTWRDGALVLTDGQALPADGDALAAGSAVAASLPPRAVKIVPPTTPSAVRDTVVALETRGNGVLRVRCRTLWADVSMAEAAHVHPRVGDPVWFTIEGRVEAFAVEERP